MNSIRMCRTLLTDAHDLQRVAGCCFGIDYHLPIWDYTCSTQSSAAWFTIHIVHYAAPLFGIPDAYAPGFPAQESLALLDSSINPIFNAVPDIQNQKKGGKSPSIVYEFLRPRSI